MKRGRKAAAAMGEYLASFTPAPKLVLCSTSLRTRETLEAILPALQPAPQTLFEDVLYLAGTSRLLDRLQRVPEQTEAVLLIGHNPGLHQLAAMLASDASELAEGFPTAALAVLRIAGAWASLKPRQATLIDFKTPKALKNDPDFGPD